MQAQRDDYETIANAAAIELLLNTMIESGGVSLCIASAEATPEPVILVEQYVGQTLVMDISSVDFFAWAPGFQALHRQAMSGHASLLIGRLQRCQWLSTSIVQAVIGGVNERLDGSGCPESVSGNDINELVKGSAVVDVVETMRRDRADRPAKTTQQIY